jgi:glycosyltransferase involved in cell wall biosynthesis
MALSRVILATSIAAEGIEIIHNENGLICDDADSFVESIDFILKNPDGMKNISIRARETVENLYNSKEAFESLGQFLKRI